MRLGGRSTAMCSKPTSWAGRWSGWRAPRTCARFWWASTRWWQWTGRRAPPRCWVPTHWPTASETFTARRGRSVCTQARCFSQNQSHVSKILIKYDGNMQVWWSVERNAFRLLHFSLWFLVKKELVSSCGQSKRTNFTGQRTGHMTLYATNMSMQNQCFYDTLAMYLHMETSEKKKNTSCEHQKLFFQVHLFPLPVFYGHIQVLCNF